LASHPESDRLRFCASHRTDNRLRLNNRVAAPPSITFVTGVDAGMFEQLFLLLGSLRHNSPGAWLQVCDLGLTEPQRDYLRRSRRLLERPAGRPLRSHVWYGKAALGDYTNCLGADFVVWLDADLIILNDIVPLIRHLCTEMQAKDQIVAAAGHKSFAALSWLDRAPGFKRAMAALDLKSPYLNSGLIICRSRELLARWAALCDVLPFESLFEQNAFNLAAYEQPERIHFLDPWIWNLCGPTFRSVQITPNGEGLAVIGQSGRVHILHATSSEKDKDLSIYTIINDTPFRPKVKVIITCSRALVKYQIGLVLAFLAAESPALIAAGLAPVGAHEVTMVGEPIEQLDPHETR